MAGALIRALGQLLLRRLQQPAALAARQPLLTLLLARVLEELFRRWVQKQRYLADRLQVLRNTDEVDSELIQGCLLSCEQLLSLGRVEKRTLFTRPLLELLGGNQYLKQEVLRAAERCRRCSSRCLVMRWMPPDERYHALQACLNATSSIFGRDYVHFNALQGETSNLFKSTWYCITVMTPTRPENSSRSSSKSRWRLERSKSETCTFTDMSRKPRATLRIAVVNETELRRLADGKLCAPTWGFFNSRHAERYRMMVDFANSFQMQLLRTPADPRSMGVRSPFTSERAHRTSSSKPDGGYIKRVHSQPNLAASALSEQQKQPVLGEKKNGMRMGNKAISEDLAANADSVEGIEGEENCFLRLHVPHYVGQQSAPAQVVVTNNASAPEVRAAMRRIGSAAGFQTGSLADLQVSEANSGSEEPLGCRSSGATSVR